jgi:hypothetical protein
MTTGTTVVKGNNTVTNEIAAMAITISVVTSTIVTYVLTLNRELGTVHPMKPVIVWSMIWFTVPRVPCSSPTTYDKSSGLEVLSSKSLTITMARFIPSYGSNFTRPLADLLWVMSMSWPITFPWWSARWGTNGLSVSLRTSSTPGMLCVKLSSKTSLPPVNSQATSTICSASAKPGMNHCVSTSDDSRICTLDS